MILLGTDDYKGLDCYLIHAEHVHVVDLLGVLDATRVTKHLKYDDYDQHHRVQMMISMKAIRRINDH